MAEDIKHKKVRGLAIIPTKNEEIQKDELGNKLECADFNSFTMEREIDPVISCETPDYFKQLSLSFYRTFKKDAESQCQLITDSLKQIVAERIKKQHQQQSSKFSSQMVSTIQYSAENASGNLQLQKIPMNIQLNFPSHQQSNYDNQSQFQWSYLPIKQSKIKKDLARLNLNEQSKLSKSPNHQDKQIQQQSLLIDNLEMKNLLNNQKVLSSKQQVNKNFDKLQFSSHSHETKNLDVKCFFYKNCVGNSNSSKILKKPLNTSAYRRMSPQLARQQIFFALNSESNNTNSFHTNILSTQKKIRETRQDHHYQGVPGLPLMQQQHQYQQLSTLSKSPHQLSPTNFQFNTYDKKKNNFVFPLQITNSSNKLTKLK